MSGQQQQPQRARGRGGRGQQRPQQGDDAPRQWGPGRGGRGGPPQPQPGSSSWGPAPGGVPQFHHHQQQQAPPQPQGAWAPRAAQSQPPAFGASRPLEQPVQAAGRATQRAPDAPQFVGAHHGEGEGAASQAVAGSRGGLRGRREIRAVEVLRTRPRDMTAKQATDGRRVELTSNFFNLEKVPSWTLYQYRVDFAPDVDFTKARMGLVRAAMKEVVPAHIFDGTVFYCSRRLNPEPYEVTVNNNKGEPIRITMRLCQDVVQSDAINIQIFNLIIRRCFRHLNLQLVKRSYYDAEAAQRVENHRLEVWPGYDTSIRQHERGIMMNVEIISKCMRVDTALDYLQEVLQQDRANYQSRFNKDIIGSVVLTDYNNKTYLVDDVDWNCSPASRFPKRDGTEISYMDYYRDRYKLNIRDTRQPMLVSRAKAREIRAGMPETVYLVPELCRMTGITEAQRKNYMFMNDLGKYTRIAPPERVRKLMDFQRRLMAKPEIRDELREWDIQLANRLISFEGRVLQREMMVFGDGSEAPAAEDASWNRAMQQQTMIYRSVLNNDQGGWYVMCTRYESRDVEGFINNVMRASHGMGWRIPPPCDYIITPDDRSGTIISQLDNLIVRARPLLIFNVLANNNKPDRYNAIKKKCYVDNPVANQVCTVKVMRGKSAMSVATKVAIQMNCKLGGAPWSVKMPKTDAMFVGFDVCHDPRDRSRNYAALVATLDQFCTKFYGNSQSHPKGDEISNYLGITLGHAIRAYYNLNKTFPSKIVIYRDGVGDGQIEYVLKHEVENIQQICRSITQGYDPKLAFIIVTKRIATRLFAHDRRNNSYSNPPPGTVVDDVVTLPERYDFFLVSQCVRQGTVTPTSYNVIFDNTGYNPSQMQRITQKLTHMYFNWSGTIRVPAPCQYAHKLAFLTSQNLQRTPNVGLSNVLFYL